MTARADDLALGDGRYLNRRQAIVSARMNGQIKDPDKIRAGMLTSEDIW